MHFRVVGCEMLCSTETRKNWGEFHHSSEDINQINQKSLMPLKAASSSCLRYCYTIYSICVKAFYPKYVEVCMQGMKQRLF